MTTQLAGQAVRAFGKLDIVVALAAMPNTLLSTLDQDLADAFAPQRGHRLAIAAVPLMLEHSAAAA